MGKRRYGFLARSTSATLSVIVFTKNRSARSLMIFFRASVIVRKLVSNTVSQSARRKACMLVPCGPAEHTARSSQPNLSHRLRGTAFVDQSGYPRARSILGDPVGACVREVTLHLKKDRAPTINSIVCWMDSFHVAFKQLPATDAPDARATAPCVNGGKLSGVGSGE